MTEQPQEEAFDGVDALLAAGGPTDCIDADAIDQEELLQYASTGAGTEELKQHVAACGYCRALLAEYKGLSEEKARSWMPTVIGVSALATAAAVGLVVLSKDTIPNYEVGAVRGAVKEVRQEQPEAEDLVFVPTSQVSITLKPQAVGTAPGNVSVFVTNSEGVLQRASKVSVTFHRDGDFASFVLNGSGQDFFGDDPGAKTLAILVASGPQDMNGKTVEQAKAQTDGQCVLLQAEYKTQLE